MSNFLDNGAVLPSGLLGHNEQHMMEGFNKSYKNVSLRVGVIVKSYPVSDTDNHSKLTTEYDVVVIEQNEDRGSTTIIYRNCMSAEGLGSIADFFEKSLRYQKIKTTKGTSVNTTGQDGAIVLLLCLDGMSDKGIIIGALTHPDRPTTLVNKDPHLEGEYNGVHVLVNADGSTSLTFKGATNNAGETIDKSQGNTVITISKDGSYQVKHSTITDRLDRSGNATLTAKADITNNTDTNFNVNANKNIALTALAEYQVTAHDIIEKAQGSASLSAQSASITAQERVALSGRTIVLNGQSSVSITAPATTVNGPMTVTGTTSLGGGANALATENTQVQVIISGIPFIGTLIGPFTTNVKAT